MAADRRVVTSDVAQDNETPKLFDLADMPDPEEVSAALVRITDCAAEALENLSEERASDGIEAALGALADVLDRLGHQLPSSPEGCDVVAEVLSAQTVEADPSGDASAPPSPAVTREEVRAGIEAVAAMLADLRAALLGVSRSDVEEIVEAGLPLARLAVSAARASALRLQNATVDSRQKSTVIIEDLDDPRSDLQPSGRDCSVKVLPKRRYLWQPLWPQLRHGAYARFRQLTTKPEDCLPATARKRPLLTLVLISMVAPPMLCCSFLVGPWVILADVLLQRVYAWKGQVVEDVLETAARALWFWLLAARLFAKQLRRFLRHQTSRLFRDYSFADLRNNFLRCVRAFGRDPLGSLQSLVTDVVSSVRWILKKLPQWYAYLPRLSDLMSPLAFSGFARA